MNNYQNMKVTHVQIFEQNKNLLEYQAPVRAQSIVP